MPSAVKELMRLVYVEKVDITKVRGEDIAIINYLKDAYPDLHKTLKKAAKEKSIHIEQDKTRNREVTHGRHSK